MESPQMLKVSAPLPTSLVLTTRIIWAALILAQLVFAAVVWAKRPQTVAPMAQSLPILIAVDAAMLLFALLVTLVVKSPLVRRGFVDEQARARRYRVVSIIPMAFLDGASMTGLVFVLTSGSWWAGIVPAIAIAVQLLLFPRARFG